MLNNLKIANPVQDDKNNPDKVDPEKANHDSVQAVEHLKLSIKNCVEAYVLKLIN